MGRRMSLAKVYHVTPSVRYPRGLISLHDLSHEIKAHGKVSYITTRRYLAPCSDDDSEVCLQLVDEKDRQFLMDSFPNQIFPSRPKRWRTRMDKQH